MLINASLINSYNIDRFCHNVLCLKIEESVKSVISLLNKRLLRYVVHYFNCRVTVFSYHIVEAKTGDASRIRDLSNVEWGGGVIRLAFQNQSCYIPPYFLLVSDHKDQERSYVCLCARLASLIHFTYDFYMYMLLRDNYFWLYDVL